MTCEYNTYNTFSSYIPIYCKVNVVQLDNYRNIISKWKTFSEDLITSYGIWVPQPILNVVKGMGEDKAAFRQIEFRSFGEIASFLQHIFAVCWYFTLLNSFYVYICSIFAWLIHITTCLKLMEGSRRELPVQNGFWYCPASKENLRGNALTSILETTTVLKESRIVVIRVTVLTSDLHFKYRPTVLLNKSKT